MAETVKVPAIGPVNRRWVAVGGALVAGIVGYAWWNRSRSSTGVPEVLPEDVPVDRVPPATVVGSEDFDTGEVRAIINTNAEWFTAAVDYLSTTGGFDFIFVSLTLGKFLSRRQLTEAEANLVQAAKGAVGDPPQGGPWPIIRTTAPGPAVANDPGVIVSGHGTRLTTDTTLISLARRYARIPTNPDSVEGTKRWIITANPWLAARKLKASNSLLKKGWIIIVPTRQRAAA